MYEFFKIKNRQDPSLQKTTMQYIFDYAGIGVISEGVKKAQGSVENFVFSSIYDEGLTFEEMMLESERVGLDATTKTLRRIYDNTVAARKLEENGLYMNGKH